MRNFLLSRTLAAMVCFGVLTGVMAPDARAEGLALEQAYQSAMQQAAKSMVQLQIIGGVDRVGKVNLADGPATGVVLSADGYVVTSLYRFNLRPTTVLAKLADGQKYVAQIVAIDRSRKLVLLKLQKASGLTPAVPSPAKSIRIGQWALALGQVYRADRPNVSQGIVSAKGRLYGRALQTDASISAANYGGPLVDIQGRVLGIISPMSPGSGDSIAGVDWYDSGVGFAVPLDEWLPAMERLKEGNDLQPGVLGVGLTEGLPRETAPKLQQVVPKGPAAKAGLQAGDLLLEIDGQPVATGTALKFALTPHYAGDTIAVQYKRAGKVNEIQVTLVAPEILAELAAGGKKDES